MATMNSCWIWLGSTDHGYGRIGWRVNGKTVVRRAHQVFYELYVGPVPAGLELHHKCSRTNCVNPKHLQPVTHELNCFLARKKLCKRGHPISGSNEYIKPSGGRQCRICKHRARNKSRQLT